MNAWKPKYTVCEKIKAAAQAAGIAAALDLLLLLLFV